MVAALLSISELASCSTGGVGGSRASFAWHSATRCDPASPCMLEVLRSTGLHVVLQSTGCCVRITAVASLQLNVIQPCFKFRADTDRRSCSVHMLEGGAPGGDGLKSAA